MIFDLIVKFVMLSFKNFDQVHGSEVVFQSDIILLLGNCCVLQGYLQDPFF